jgi:hypothetical protein
MNAIRKIYHLEMKLEQFTANPRQSRYKLSLEAHKIAAISDIYYWRFPLRRGRERRLPQMPQTR